MYHIIPDKLTLFYNSVEDQLLQSVNTMFYTMCVAYIPMRTELEEYFNFRNDVLPLCNTVAVELQRILLS